MTTLPDCNCCQESDAHGTCMDPDFGLVCSGCLVALADARRVLRDVTEQTFVIDETEEWKNEQ